MKVEFHPDAAEEFAATAVYYNAERYGLGRRFRDAVVNAIDRIGFGRSVVRARGGDACRSLGFRTTSCTG